MKNVLIINGHQFHEGVAKGELTHNIINRADEVLSQNGFTVKHSVVDVEYDIKEESDKLVWADYIIIQYPVYWMSLPWKAKKYFDEVLTQGVHYINDGRSRTDDSKKYGTGGLLTNTKYMLSLTYNCPASEFDNNEGFFDGFSLDEAHCAVHKTLESCGLKKLETYAIFDIFKGDLDLNKELDNFENILTQNFL